MTLQIGEEYTDPAGDGVLGVVISEITNCFSDWTVTAKTTTSVWIEWNIVGGFGSVTKDVGTAINGETLNADTTYSAIVDTFQSYDKRSNELLSEITFTLKDSEGGTVLDSVILSRFSSGFQC